MEKGIVVALVTPLNEDETIDVGSLERLIEWIIKGGVNGVFLAGTIGEGSALRDSVRQTLFVEAVRCVRHRITVLANVSDTGTLRAVDMARAAAKAGVDMMVATPRIGFPQRRRGETVQHIRAIAAASSVPVWFYENPTTTQVTSSFEDICEIISLPNVTGVKFSSPDRALFTRCVRELPKGVPVMTGNVSDIAYAGSIGALGVVSGIGSLVPGLCVRVFKAAIEGRAAEAERLQNAISGVYSIYGGQGHPFWPSAQKHALKRRGVLRTSVVAAPLINLTAEDGEIVDAALAQLDESLFAPA